ncbi:radical SAM protein [Saccharicrinis fermentans]|uniref:FeMo cofactor biosynthesis protein NifB n=1 Tax=Saccharicrinis fermentans DSM 9555 = JCM 21142 TaxID=869213 RepID=W7Y1R6_9BACT|nr:radical SAM protein [Saccharicrinis fermentans]GAF04825.1 putative molybdopterin cofactor synthesis protein A [Saccharicrinis fermentans DSM 9555 = JCM 21142]
MIDFKKHPCFNKEAKGQYARVHLPVAPKCNISCNYCNRKFDCVNESRPGVTSNILSPEQSIIYLTALQKKMPQLSVVGIAGPGDPFANPEETMETLRQVRSNFPEMILCVSSNGLNIAPYINELATLKVSHVTITINSLDPKILEKVYRWVRYEKKGYFGLAGAELLLRKQLEAITKLKSAGITVKANAIVIPGINDTHLGALAKGLSELGVDLMNTIPLIPVEETPFSDLTEPGSAHMKEIRKEIGAFLPPMTHCSRCRADAAGLLGKDSTEAMELLTEAAKVRIDKGDADKRPYVAVASNEGILVNQHLGEADRLYVFKETPNGYKLVNQRVTPSKGNGDSRWEELGNILSDCKAILVGGIGPKPSKILGKSGLQVIEMSGLIDQGMDAVYKGTELRTITKAESFKCGAGCSGTGTGCG